MIDIYIYFTLSQFMTEVYQAAKIWSKFN